MGVRVIRVESIPYGLSALIDGEPGSLIVWLSKSEWPEGTSRLLERVLAAAFATEAQPAVDTQSEAHTV